MNNIEKAMQIEQEYLASTDKKSLLELLKPYGFTSLAEFQDAKKKKSVLQTDLSPKTCNIVDSLTDTIKNLFEGQGGLYVNQTDCPFIFSSYGVDFDVAEYEAKNIPVIQVLDYEIYPILCDSSDLNFCVCIKGQNVLFCESDLIEYLKDSLKKYIPSIDLGVYNTFIKNGNEEIGNYMSWECENNMTVWTIHFRFCNHPAIVDQVLLRDDSNLQSGYISECTREDILAIVQAWYKEVER